MGGKPCVNGRPAIDQNLEALSSSIASLVDSSGEGCRFDPGKYLKLEEAFANIAGSALLSLRDKKWNRRDYELKSELATKEETKDALHTLRPDFIKEEPLTICGEFVAFRFLAFINFLFSGISII